MWDTFIPDMKNFSWLSPGRNFQFFIAIQGWNFNVRAQDSLRNIDIQVQENIVLAALEELMRSHIQNEEQTSVRSTKDARPTLPCQTDLRPTIHTGGNLNFLLDGLAFESSRMTSLAG